MWKRLKSFWCLLFHKDQVTEKKNYGARIVCYDCGTTYDVFTKSKSVKISHTDRKGSL